MKWFILISLICLMALTTEAQTLKSTPSTQSNGIFQVSVGTKETKIALSDGDGFVDPANSLIKLGRQANIQFLPTTFFPKVELEKDPKKRTLLRYAVAYYRECQVVGFEGLVDVLVGLRLDNRDGIPRVSYFSTYTVINSNKVQFQEDRMAMAIVPESEASALLYFKSDGNDQLVSLEKLFEDPHTVNLLSLSDIEGIATDDRIGKFAIFVRGGSDRASLFVLNTNTTLSEVVTFEVIKNLLPTQRAYIFAIVPIESTPSLPYRGALIK